LEEEKQEEAQTWRKSCSRLSVGLFFLMPGGFGPSPDTAASKEFITRIFLAAVLEGWATHITRILLASERSRRRRKREKQKLAPYKIYSLCHS
jgi:hypothetical protein